MSFPSFVVSSVVVMHKSNCWLFASLCGMPEVSEVPVNTCKLREPCVGTVLGFVARSATPGTKRSSKLFSARLAQPLERQKVNLGEVFLSLGLQVKGL